MTGGLDLGLERAGMQCRWQVEIDDHAQKILKKHWPDVARFRDVRDCGKENLEWVDLIAGGFPCQDISKAGKRAGIHGKRSGLWSEYHRIICELRPKYVLVENVTTLLRGGIETVLGDLAASGYDAEWQCLPASAFGAPHRRDRVFIIAHTNKQGFKFLFFAGRIQARRLPCLWESFGTVDNKIWLEDYCGLSRNNDGIPHRVDRLRCLGNAVVPQVAQWIGERILQAAKGESP